MNNPDQPDYTHMTGAEIRALSRSGRFDRPTTGVAMGYTQANLVVLRTDVAADFETFCRRNPKPCPLLEVTEPGSFEPKLLAPGADLRTDLPRYRVYRHGECVDRPTSIEAIWETDFVAFLIGCSFTFESALLDAGLPVRHIEEGCNVPMYRTNIPCKPAGPFAAPMVVSMRPMTPDQADQATHVTAKYPRVHGPPIHTGDPATIGITDLARPDYGDPVTIHPHELPVFWACGVTPMEAIIHAKPPLAITHDPGHMLVTDILDRDLEDSLEQNQLRGP